MKSLLIKFHTFGAIGSGAIRQLLLLLLLLLPISGIQRSARLRTTAAGAGLRC
jgi:hypothetical protein